MLIRVIFRKVLGDIFTNGMYISSYKLLVFFALLGMERSQVLSAVRGRQRNQHNSFT
jgi:hypothetical protein